MSEPFGPYHQFGLSIAVRVPVTRSTLYPILNAIDFSPIFASACTEVLIQTPGLVTIRHVKAPEGKDRQIAFVAVKNGVPTAVKVCTEAEADFVIEKSGLRTDREYHKVKLV